MIFTTNFDVRQTVYPIKQQSKVTTTPACEVCNGENFGGVEIDVPKFGKLLINCPEKRADHNNHGPITVDVNTDWVVLSPERIIKVTARWERADDPNFKPFWDNGVRYALTPNSLHSHRVWKQEDLFASAEEAEANCKRRNEELKNG